MPGVHISYQASCGVHIPRPSTEGIVYTLLQFQLRTGLNPKLCIFRPHFEISSNASQHRQQKGGTRGLQPQLNILEGGLAPH